VLLAGFKLVLMMYSGQTDMVVGTTFANHPAGKLDLMESFLNILPIRTQLKAEESFEQLVAAERAAVQAALANSDVPFQDIVAASGVARTAAYLPLCNVMVALGEEGKQAA
jgi:non-ribosomal peptide synthetase component F